jgi:hypothetical protein
VAVPKEEADELIGPNILKKPKRINDNKVVDL